MSGTHVSVAIAVTLFASCAAHAVNLSPNAIGQALVYPYYTVNAGQQTLLTIVNTAAVGKAVKVRFFEAYNGREVLDFNLFLSPHDVWSANVFKLSDAGIAGSGAGIFTSDSSCLSPPLTQGPLPNGFGYQQFLDYGYTGANADSGPSDDARMNEGHFEAIAMSDIVDGSALSAATRHVNGVPPGCSQAEVHFESETDTVAPTSSLFGSAGIVDVAEGTFFAYAAVALDGFTAVRLDAPSGSVSPNLAAANDPCCSGNVTAYQFIGGRTVASVFSSQRAIDAVSAVFAADALYNEYVSGPGASSGTDWVVTFPTKRFYVDPAAFTPSQQPSQQIVPPFEHLFGLRETGNAAGMSCVQVAASVFGREEEAFPQHIPCDGATHCPPPEVELPLCLETNVLRFQSQSVVGSPLATPVLQFGLNAGMLQLDLAYPAHDVTNSLDNHVFHGLPVVGFSVTRFVNGNVTLPGGGFTLANYSAAAPHRWTTSCSAADGPCS